MRLAKRVVVVLVAVAAVYAAVGTLAQAASGRESPAALAESEMSTRKLIMQIPVQVKIPETGLSGIELEAHADPGAGLIRCGGPVYTLVSCTPGMDSARIVAADLGNRWTVPGRDEWVGSFHLWRVDFERGTYNIVIEAVRADDENGDPVEIPPMTVSVTVD